MMTILFQLLLSDLVFIVFCSVISNIFWDSSSLLMPTWWKMLFGAALLLMFPIMFIMLMLMIWS